MVNFKSLKGIVKGLLPPVVLRAMKSAQRKEQKYYALNDLDKQMEAYLSHTNGFYVELGANDGVNQSNTFYFEKHKGWHGLLIEPSPHNFLKCLDARGGKNTVVCAACVGFDFEKEFVPMTYLNLMSIADQVETDIVDRAAHIESGKRFLASKDQVFTFGAKARTLNSILDDASAPSRIDFLSLDVEGSEIEVLKGVDHNKYRFDFILVESRDFAKIKMYLEGLNYDYVNALSVHDYLFTAARK